MRDRLSYSCIPVGSLICPSVGRQVPESEVPVPGTKCPESLIRCTEATFIPDDSNQYQSNVEYIINTRMSSVVCGNKIYMLGGTKGFYNYSRLLSPDVMQFEIKGDRILGDPNSYLKNPMLSDKGLDSIALHHNNMLYVLANNSFGTGTDDNTFESYNVKDDQWSLLEPPPFYRAYLSSVREIVSYVVIGDNICVSTKLAAFSYNISSNQWESCSLFDGFSLSRDDYDDEVWKRCEETKIKGGEANGIKFGQPFDFLGEGLLFEDFLIGANWIEESVVAYRIVDGKVKQSRRLFYVPKPRDSSQDHYLYYLLELGEGYFTVAFFTETNTSARTVTLVIVVFHVSREIEASGDIFLSSKICCTHEIKTPREDSNGLTDPLFFTMQEGGDGGSGVLRST